MSTRLLTAYDPPAEPALICRMRKFRLGKPGSASRWGRPMPCGSVPGAILGGTNMPQKNSGDRSRQDLGDWKPKPKTFQ